MRAAIFSAIEASLTGPVKDALHQGSSVGESTLALRDWLEHCQAVHGEGPMGLKPELRQFRGARWTEAPSSLVARNNWCGQDPNRAANWQLLQQCSLIT